MEIIKSFDFNGGSLSVYGTTDKPMFKAKEVGKLLGIKKVNNSLDCIPKEYTQTITHTTGNGLGMPPKRIKYINEPALYMLSFKSRKEDAIKFTKWVCEEVLPSIRKTGKYEYKEKRYINQNQELSIHNENELHYAVISYINTLNETKHKKIRTSIGMGEYLDSSDKRIDAFKKGYVKGAPDIIILNKTYKYDGLLIELKTPKGNGELSEAQQDTVKEFKDMRYKILVSNNYAEIITKLNKYIDNIRIPCMYCNRRFKNHKTRKNHYLLFHRIK